jgi:hypothetical protein
VTKASRHHVVSRRADLTNRWWRIANNTRNERPARDQQKSWEASHRGMESETSPTCSCQRPRETVRLVISGCSTWPAACRIAPVRADSVERAQPTGPTDSSLRRRYADFPIGNLWCLCRSLCDPSKGRSGRGPHLERDARQHFSRSRADYRRPPARTRRSAGAGSRDCGGFAGYQFLVPATSRLCSTPSSKRPTRYAGREFVKASDMRHSTRRWVRRPGFSAVLSSPFRAPINRIIGLRAFVRANETGF